MTGRLRVLALFLGLTVPVAAWQPGQGDGGLHAAFTADMFTEVRVSDALAALQLWGRQVTRGTELDGPLKVEVLSVEDIVQGVADDRIDLVVLRSPAFVTIRSRFAATPVNVTNFDGRAEVPSLLVVHRSSGLSDLEALQGRDLLVVDNTLNAPGVLWLEIQVMKRGHTDLKGFFSGVRQAAKVSQAVLPVFFRQAAAALVDESSFKVMTDLNPQLAKDLVVLERSPAVVPAFVVIRSNFDPRRRPQLLKAVAGMADTPRGLQLLTLFKTRAILPFRPEMLEGVERLVAEHARLKASPPRGGTRPGSPP